MKSLDIEAALITWLNKQLSAPVYAVVEGTRPMDFVTVERTGGAKDSMIVDRPTVAVQCWAKSKEEAAGLAYQIDDLVERMTEIQGITKASRNSLYNFPDLSGGGSRARYQIVLNFVTTN